MTVKIDNLVFVVADETRQPGDIIHEPRYSAITEWAAARELYQVLNRPIRWVEIQRQLGRVCLVRYEPIGSPDPYLALIIDASSSIRQKEYQLARRFELMPRQLTEPWNEGCKALARELLRKAAMVLGSNELDYYTNLMEWLLVYGGRGPLVR